MFPFLVNIAIQRTVETTLKSNKTKVKELKFSGWPVTKNKFGMKIKPHPKFHCD
jgi:hypothetical protein